MQSAKDEFAAILISLLTAILAGCAAHERVSINFLKDPPCLNASGIGWAGPESPEDRARLSDWCRSVGPVVINGPNVRAIDVAKSGLIVVTWNQHEDFGDLERLLKSLVKRTPVVALVQEIARASESVPLDVPSTVPVPARIGQPKPIHRDIAAIAADLNMSLAYLPSMPNGIRTGEDRGCAILSTLPMSDIVGIELPWVTQRRVAVMATVAATNQGLPWRLRVVNIHLDNRLGRGKQAAAIVDFLDRQNSPHLPVLIGGDLNAWFGIRDRAVREIDRVIPRIRECGQEATYRIGGLRLDHLFTTLPDDVLVRCFVEHDHFGSDHHPIVLRLFK